MRIRYIIPFKQQVVVPDHWDIPLMGGVCRIVEDRGKAKALEIVFSGQPVTFAPLVAQLTDGPAKASITTRGPQIAFVKQRLDDAMPFLQCYFNIDLAMGDIEARYEGETPEEEEQIHLKSMATSTTPSKVRLSFDMLTRAIMAAEAGTTPIFEATLANTARNARFEGRHIDAFRYAFLLIEALYGDGKFRKEALKEALNGSDEFVEFIDAVLKDQPILQGSRPSETRTLLSGAPDAAAVIDHLVEKRGIYFHGNAKRKGTWKPHAQDEAEDLAVLAILIVQQITGKAAAHLFDPTHDKRHFEDAKKAGAVIVYNIKFKYRQPEEVLLTEKQFNMTVPGTKVTPDSAFYVAKQFLDQFEHNLPVAHLSSAECVVKETGQPVFDLKFHVDRESP